MAFGGEKIEELLADFTAFHNLHPSLIVATGGTRSDSEPTGQGAHHTIRRNYPTTSAVKLKLFLISGGIQHLENHVKAETARLHEAHLFRFFFGIMRQGAEFSLPNVTSSFQFGVFEARQGIGDQFLTEPLLMHFMGDALRTKARTSGMEELSGSALVGQPVTRRQII